MTVNYLKSGDADIRFLRSKYCHIATDVEVVNITRSYRPLLMLLPGDGGEIV